MAFRVSDGRRTLNETTGSGVRVTVLNEETVIPRNDDDAIWLLLLSFEVGSVDVIIATG